MKRQIFTLVASLLVGLARADVFVYPSQDVGPIKPMNGVNNGPADDTSTRSNFRSLKAIKVPFARTHDSSFSSSCGGEHTVDITSVFPDFSKKVDDPASYDFTITDWFLDRIRSTGAEVFFRLGQKIEHQVKKYGIMPPKDFKKWAQICEHIIRHYNEGWADGHEWNIRYWEIWNEPDLDIKQWNTNPRTWGGTEEQFFDLYATTAKHLKKCFPSLLIGGPAIAGDEKWADRFLTHMMKNEVPIDFFSWHIYSTKPKRIGEVAERMRKLVDDHGYTKAETILDEWNYIRGWEDDYCYSLMKVPELKGAAFTAATMTVCQNAPVDILMYYDVRPDSPFNGLFDYRSYKPLPPYYSFYAWSRLASLGRQVKAEIKGEEDLYVVAAKGDEGIVRTMVTRYNNDDNVNRVSQVTIHVEGARDGEVYAYDLNSSGLYSQTVLEVKDGAVTVLLEPNAMIVVETKN